MDRPVDRVSSAFQAVPREEFLPAGSRREAAYDGPVAIGHGQTNSQPSSVAAMLRLLDAQPGQRVLDVGAGSGWTTALLAHLVGPTGAVVGVELVPELAAWGEANVRRTSGAWASVREAAPGVLGVGGADQAPSGCHRRVRAWSRWTASACEAARCVFPFPASMKSSPTIEARAPLVLS